MSSVATAQDTWDALLCEVDKYGNRFWYDADGKSHRENGPAVIYKDGTQFWFKHGKSHRENGPAAIYADGTQVWYKHGKMHREDGPAVIYYDYNDGEVEYWIDGFRVHEKHFNARKLTVNG